MRVRSFSLRTGQSAPRRIGATRLVALAGALRLAGTACQAAPSTSIKPVASGQAPASAPPPRVIQLDAREFGYAAPTSVQGGRVTIQLTNHGQEAHHAQLLRMNDGVTFQQFGAALQQYGEAALAMTSIEGGAGAIAPRGTSEVSLDLKPGQYALVCFLPSPDGVPHLAKGMIQPLEVTAPPTAAAPAPAAQGTFSMKDFTFTMPETLPAGKATYRVVNEGPQPHELNVVRLAPEKNGTDVLTFLKNPAGPPPFEPVGGMNGLDNRREGLMTLEISPGDYAAICMIPYPATGVSHVHLGMIKLFSVR